MNKNDSNSSLFQMIHKKDFDQLVAKWSMDKGIRSFSTREMTSALVTCMTVRLNSFREIEQTLGIPRATFGDALGQRCYGFFEELCDQVLNEIRAKTYNRKIKKAIREIMAIDSSECQVHGSLFREPLWKRPKSFGHKASCKLHVVYNVDQKWIDNFIVAGSRQADSPMSGYLRLLPNKIYVFDRAYSDLNFWLRITRAGSHFVTRLRDCKKNRAILVEVIAKDPKKTGVLFDRRYEPSPLQKHKHRDRMKEVKFRYIIYRDPMTDKIFHFITSDLKLAAQVVTDIYKKRWAVELLFRWLKGHLDIRYLAVKSLNAVKIQLAVAVLIQFLLQLKKIVLRLSSTLWELLRLIRADIVRQGLALLDNPGYYRRKNRAANGFKGRGS